MLESVEITGWDGIARGELPDLASHMVLVCSNARCRRALSSALSLFWLEEQWLELYELMWSQSGSRCVSFTTLASLVTDGRATIHGCRDGRPLRLNMDARNGRSLKATIDGTDNLLFEIGIDGSRQRLTGLHGISGGPRTMLRRSFIAELSGRGTDFVRELGSRAEQSFLLAESSLIAQTFFGGLSDDERQRWTIRQLSFAEGVLSSDPSQ